MRNHRFEYRIICTETGDCQWGSAVRFYTLKGARETLRMANSSCGGGWKRCNHTHHIERRALADWTRLPASQARSTR